MRGHFFRPGGLRVVGQARSFGRRGGPYVN